MQKYSHIIWDWNGTLLDDVALSIASVNVMLKKRNMPTLDSIDAYHNVFCFPVIDYYRRMGFNFDIEPFDKIAVEYIDLYYNDMGGAELFPEAIQILADCHRIGIRQIILSASESSRLLSQIEPFDIFHFFDDILGIDNIYATSKTELGRDYINRIKPEDALMIGDTIHDKQVADALGIDCVIVACGHQSKRTLLSCGATVLDSLPDVRTIIGI